MSFFFLRRKVDFAISVKRLEIVENFNKAHLSTHWLAVQWCHKQLYSFVKAPVEWMQLEHDTCGHQLFILFQVMNPGMLVLGCVAEIHNFKLIVSLPNGLSGTVSLTEISPEYTSMLEQMANDESLSNVRSYYFIAYIWLTYLVLTYIYIIYIFIFFSVELLTFTPNSQWVDQFVIITVYTVGCLCNMVHQEFWNIVVKICVWWYIHPCCIWISFCENKLVTV